MSMAQHSLASLFQQACLAEIEALKPGNVHIFADGHGMTVQDFMRSAEVASAPIAAPGASVGQRVLGAVEATWQAVACNTNLGILLLSAPLLRAAEHPNEAGLRDALQAELAALSIEDARLTFQAIVCAAPAGLGESPQADVHGPATVTLLEAMRTAQARDLIAKQYVTAYADIFAAAAFYEEVEQRWQRPAWATTAVYLRFLAQFDDSHIVRKYGQAQAAEVRHEAEGHYEAFIALENPKTYMSKLLEFDARLKAGRLNPGTSADLTVAALLCSALQRSPVS